jgi:hypothetical protein
MTVERFVSLEYPDLAAQLHDRLRTGDDAKKDEDEGLHVDGFQDEKC